MLQNLTYEMSVLAKAVEYKNLSVASIHVGLSQPQLSRLVSKIEQELNVVLLDRSARRKSGWTPIAVELSQTFSKGLSRMESEILAIAQERETSELRIGTLEGLSGIATQFAHRCFKNLKIKIVFLDILDFKDLDSQFLAGSLDLIFTVKSPGRQKFAHLIEVGTQQMEQIKTDPHFYVCSPSELTADKKIQSSFAHLFVSNSLSLRQKWFKDHGGTGALPVDTRKGRGKAFHSVYLIGSDLISSKLWQQISELMQDES